MTELVSKRDWRIFEGDLRGIEIPDDAEVIKPGVENTPRQLRVFRTKSQRTQEEIGLAELVMDAKHTFPPHVHCKSGELMLILSGKGTMRLADTMLEKCEDESRVVRIVASTETIEVEPGTVIVIPPGRAQAISIPLGKEMTMKTLMCPPYDPADEHHVEF